MADKAHDLAYLQQELDDALEGKAHFKLGKRLGGGVHGTVFVAERTDPTEPNSPTHAAVKVIQRSDATENIISREIAILFRLTHPNIVKLIGVGETEDFVFVLLEYVRGGDLYKLVIASDDGLSEAHARSIFTALADALSYTHKCRICHRDIKLENILMDENGSPRLTDFGLSKVMSTHKGHALVHNQSMCGSPDYASPEIWRKRDYAGPEVDVWSLGVVLFCMVTKEFPFDGPRSIMAGAFTPPAFLSPSLRDLLRRMLEVDRKKRITVDDALQHAWVRAASPMRAPPDVPARMESTSKLVGMAPQSLPGDAQHPAAEAAVRGGAVPLHRTHREDSGPALDALARAMESSSSVAGTTSSLLNSVTSSFAELTVAATSPPPVSVSVHAHSPTDSQTDSPRSLMKLLVQVKRLSADGGEGEGDALETQNLVVPVAASDTVSKLLLRVRRRAFPNHPASLELRAYITKNKIVSSLWRDDLVGDVVEREDTVLVIEPSLLSLVTDDLLSRRGQRATRRKSKRRSRSSRTGVSRDSDGAVPSASTRKGRRAQGRPESTPVYVASATGRRHSGPEPEPPSMFSSDSESGGLNGNPPKPASPPLVPHNDVVGISPLAVFRTLSLRIPTGHEQPPPSS